MAFASNAALGWFFARDISYCQKCALPRPTCAAAYRASSRDRAFEIVDRFRHLLRVERVEPNPSLGERMVGIEAAGLAKRTSRRRIAATADCRRELRDDAVLEVEDVGEQSVRLAVGERLAARGVDRARGDAQAIPRSLEASDHRHVELQLASKGRQVVARALGRLDDARAIEDPDLQCRAQVVGDRFGNAGRQPVERRVAGHVREIEHANRGQARACRPRLMAGRRRGLLTLDRRDEAITASRNRLDVGRLRRIVAERLPQLRHRLRQRVVGDRHVRPERGEQLLLRNQR